MNMPSFSLILPLIVLLWIPHTCSQCSQCSAETSSFATRPYYVRPQQPTIVSEPMDKAVHQEVLRSMITIECVVQIQSIVSGWWPHIYWRHNGSIVNSTWPAMAGIDTNFWNFSVLHTSFPGSYQCVVDDGSFVLVSREAQISLLSIYPDPNPPLWHSVEACHGQMLHLSCQPVTADYQAQVIWRKNGLVLPDSQQYMILQPGGPGDLVIYNFSQKDVGNYSCSTGYGHIITGHSVTQSTESCRSWSDIHVVASREYIQQGENLFLVCLIRVANIRFTWFKEGKLLTVPVTGPGVLQVPNTSDSDLGNYTCRATTDNASPVAFASIIVKRFENVSVTAPPFDGWLSYSASGLIISSITLTCAATGSPPVVTTWFHNGRPVQGNKSIVIHSGTNATQEFGMYQCFVKNLHSEAHQQFRVKLKSKPNPPGIVTHVVSSGIYTELNLTWLPSEDLLPKHAYAVQYLRVSGGASVLDKQLGSRVSSTKVTLKQRCTYRFYIEASTTKMDESQQWALFSSKGNASDPFSCCSPTVIGNGSVNNFSCEAEYTYINDTVRCDFQWTPPDACKNGSIIQSTISVFCPNGFKQNQQTVHDNASIDHIPCNTQCKVSVSTVAWDVRTSNKIACQDRTNQTFRSASIAPSQPAVINRWNKSCSGKDLVLFVSIPSPTCGNATWYSVHYNNVCSRRYQLLDYEKDMMLNISLPDKFQWRNVSLSVVYGNPGGASPLSNTVQVPGITQDDVQDCIGYDCQQKPDKIVCSLDFPARWNLTEFKNATFTFLDCNVLCQSQIPCSLEMEGCNSVCNVTVAVVANQLVNGSCPSTCPTYTYCIIAHVAMEPGKSVYLNSTAQSKPCSASRSSSSTSAPTMAVMSSQDTNYIMYILIAGLILLVVVLLVIMAVIGGYCIGHRPLGGNCLSSTERRRKQSNDMLESLRTISSLQESNLGTSADGRNDSLPDGDQYHLQSTVHPDGTTQICPVDGSQTDLTSQWVEEQQRLADESEESDVDESHPLLSAYLPSTGSRVTSSPRPNHPDGSSQIKDLDSPERAGYQYVHTLLTRNVMQQQPSQLSGLCHSNYVELQGCRTRTEQSQPTETSTTFAGASDQSLFSASSPYVPGRVFGSRDDNRSSGPLTTLEDNDESLGPSLLSASNFSMQPSPSPTTTCSNGYISVPHSTVAVDCIHDLNTKKGILSLKMCKRDILDAPDSPPGSALPSWSPPSLYGTNSMNSNSDTQ